MILSQHCPTDRVTQTRNLAWLVKGLLVAAPCQLNRLAPHLPWDGERDSIIQRLRRILIKARLDVRTLYGPTVGYLLQVLKGPAGIVLVIDRTTLSNDLNLLMIGVAFRGRVLPLAWKVQKKLRSGASASPNNTSASSSCSAIAAACKWAKRWQRGGITNRSSSNSAEIQEFHYLNRVPVPYASRTIMFCSTTHIPLSSINANVEVTCAMGSPLC